MDVIRAEEKSEEGSDTAKPAQPGGTDRAAGKETAEAESPQTGQPWRLWCYPDDCATVFSYTTEKIIIRQMKKEKNRISPAVRQGVTPNLNYIMDVPVDIIKFDRNMKIAYYKTKKPDM